MRERKNCLHEGERLIVNDRHDDYGDPVEMAHRIAHAWSGIVGHKITAGQYCLMMAALKLVRQSVNPKEDNLDDAAGYILMNEMVEHEKDQNHQEG